MSAAPITLRGMTWDHARGFDPLAATAASYEALHPGVSIIWERRSLKDFEEFPVNRLAAEFDLIVFDHPFVGDAAQNGPLLPLDEHLSDEYLADQNASSVGESHRSYRFAGHQWALAIDAAAPVALWREDILETVGAAVPETWDGLMTLAKRGHVEVPAAPINCLMNFYSLCMTWGEAPFATPFNVVGIDVGTVAIEHLRELVDACGPGCLTRNPIASHDLLASASNTRVAYCPLAYGYSNYAREGFAPHRLTFGQPPTCAGKVLRTTLGGTGLGVSALRPNHAAAVDYAAFVASGEVQRTIYTQSGGQPGHRSAWLDEANNRMTNDCFTTTLPVLDRAYLRPRYFGYVTFQEAAGPIIHAAVRGELAPAEAINRIDAIYRDTLKRATVHA